MIGKRKFLLSSFSDNEKRDFSKKIEENGGSCLDTPYWQTDCDIVVCKQPTRSEKYLCGCAAGKPLVTPDYVKDSLKARRWLNPDLYQWSKQGNKKHEKLLLDLPEKCLEKLHNGENGVFGSWVVLLHVEPMLKSQAYKRLLQAGGAKVIRRKPPFSKELAKELTHVFATKDVVKDLHILHKNNLQLILFPEYIPEYLINQPNHPDPEKFAHFKKKSAKSPQKTYTPKSKQKTNKGAEKEMKNQRKITDMFSRKDSSKRKSEENNNQPSPKRLCTVSDMFNTPIKTNFQQQDKNCFHSPFNVKIEPSSPPPTVNQNKEKEIINLISDSEGEEEEVKAPDHTNEKKVLLVVDDITETGQIKSTQHVSSLIEIDSPPSTTQPSECKEENATSAELCKEVVINIEENLSSQNENSFDKTRSNCVKALFSPKEKLNESKENLSQGSVRRSGRPRKIKRFSEQDYVFPKAASSHGNKIDTDLSELRKIPDLEFKRRTRSFTPDKTMIENQENQVSSDSGIMEEDEIENDEDEEILLEINKATSKLDLLSLNTKLITQQKGIKRVPLLNMWKNDIESSLDEKEFYPALCLLKDKVSTTYYPQSKILSRFLYLLREQTEPYKRMELFCLLQSISLIHPVHHLPQIYEMSLKKPIEDNHGNILPSEFIDEILLSTAREVLEMASEEYNPRPKELSSHLLLVVHLVDLLKGNLINISNDILNGLESEPAEDLMNKLKKTLIYRMIWERSKQFMREVIEFYVSLSQCTTSETLKLRLQFVELVHLILQCCKVKDQISQGIVYGNSTVEFVDFYKSQIIPWFKAPDTSYSIKQLIFTNIRDGWLKCRVCEALLNEMDINLVPKRKKSLMDKNLSIEKIIFFYFFVVPVQRKEKRDVIQKQKQIPFSPKNINKKNGKGETPLHVACNKNNLSKVRYFLQQGAEVNTKDNAGWTPLHEACCYGNVDVAKELISSPDVDLFYTRGSDSGVADGTSALHDAVRNNQMAIVELLLNKGGSELSKLTDKDGYSAIDFATNKEMKDLIYTHSNKRTNDIFQLSTNQHMYKDIPQVSSNQVDELLLILDNLIKGYLTCKDEEMKINRNILMKQYNLFQQHILSLTKPSLKSRLFLKAIYHLLF